MACAFFPQSENRSEVGALDLSCKPRECNNCSFSRFNVPIAAQNTLQQWPKQNLHNVSLFAFNFNYNANKGLEPPQGFCNEVRGNSELLASAFGHNPERLVQHYNDCEMKSPNSTTTSTGSSPVNSCYWPPAFPGANPDTHLHEPFKQPSFSPFPMGVVSPTQLSINALWTVHPAMSSPPTTINSSPVTTIFADEPSEALRYESSSPAARSLRSLSPLDSFITTKKRKIVASPNDKNSAYMLKRLKNNLAAKRSRDMRRLREDRIARACHNMHQILHRVKRVRIEYVRVLVSNGL